MRPELRDDITAKSIASSINKDGIRIDTLQLRYPRIIHAEFMTHRVFSRNASSSRAIPTASILTRDENIFVPVFRHNKAGMQPGDRLTPEEQVEAEAIWRDMADYVTKGCQRLADKNGLNIHKQWTNRPLEWFGYIDVLVTSTDWANFDALRDHGAAQDEIDILCRKMKAARNAVTPTFLENNEWHLPYVTQRDREQAWNYACLAAHSIRHIVQEGDWQTPSMGLSEALLIIASAARACRVSFSKMDGTPSTFDDDLDRFRKLTPVNDPVHASPLEHQAIPLGELPKELQGNFRGWAQFRKMVPAEAVKDFS